MMSSGSQPMDRRALRRFGMTMGGMIAGLFGLLLPLLVARQFPAWPWVLAGLFFGVALLAPQALRLVHTGWMTLGGALGRINGRIVLALLYYLVVVPMGLAMKLWGKDPLARKLAAEETTYRVVRKESDLVERMEKPF